MTEMRKSFNPDYQKYTRYEKLSRYIRSTIIDIGNVGKAEKEITSVPDKLIENNVLDKFALFEKEHNELSVVKLVQVYANGLIKINDNGDFELDSSYDKDTFFIKKKKL